MKIFIVYIGVKVTGTANITHLLSTLISDKEAKFQLAVSENKDIFSLLTLQTL
jgi:hypothetical protein